MPTSTGKPTKPDASKVVEWARGLNYDAPPELPPYVQALYDRRFTKSESASAPESDPPSTD